MNETTIDSPTLNLARALIERHSVTPADAGCLEIIGERLTALGFDCQRLDKENTSNLWARKGNNSPCLVFAGHTDVVPAGPLEQWQSPPFTPSLRGGRLYGRGAADMKSSLAAFVTAIESFLTAHPNHAGSIALLLTSDEEGDARYGTRHVIDELKARGETADYCLVGEPTSVSQLGDMLKNGRRGSLSGQLTVRGVQGHIAYPHLARNPIHQFAAALDELVNTVWDQGNDYFPPTTWQISNIHAGTGTNNVIPGELAVQFNFRFASIQTAEGLQARVHELLDRHDLNYQINWHLSGNPYLTERGTLVDALQKSIHQETGLQAEVSTTGGTSDGRFIAQWCPQVVEFGPINASIHKINEHINITDIEPLAAIYRNLLIELLSQ